MNKSKHLRLAGLGNHVVTNESIGKVKLSSLFANDLDLIDEDLQHLKMNMPVHLVSRDEIVKECFSIDQPASNPRFFVDMN